MSRILGLERNKTEVESFVQSLLNSVLWGLPWPVVCSLSPRAFFTPQSVAGWSGYLESPGEKILLSLGSSKSPVAQSLHSAGLHFLTAPVPSAPLVNMLTIHLGVYLESRFQISRSGKDPVFCASDQILGFRDQAFSRTTFGLIPWSC